MKKYVITIIVSIVLGFALCYFTMPSKTSKTSTDIQVATQTQTHTVIKKHKDGSSTTVIDTNTQRQTQENRTSLVEINKKSYLIMPIVAVSPSSNGFGAMFQADVVGPLGVGIGGLYLTTKTFYAVAGVSIKF